MTDTFSAPETLDHLSAFRFATQLRGHGSRTDFILDLSHLKFATPSGMVILLDTLQRRSVGCSWKRTQCPAESYLSHFGFFDALNGKARVGDMPDAGQMRYVPITSLVVADLRARAREDLIVVQEYIARWSGILSANLLQRKSGPAWQVVQFTLQELIRNVVEHSKAERVVVTAQYWPQREEAEIALLDGGIGVAKSLSQNPKLVIESEAHALNLAVLPGVSSSAVAGRRTDDEWQNSGFGLYMTSSIARAHGFFVLASGFSSLLLDSHGKRSDVIPSVGTMVGIRMSTSPDKLKSIHLPSLAAAGEKVADVLAREGRSPEAASRALRWND